MKRLGVIDCGTNTFHLLIAEQQRDGTFHTLYRERRYVRLGQDGLGHIGEAPFQRGVECIAYFKKILEENGVQKIKVFGTEALRRAGNSTDFIDAVEATNSIRIQLISGEEEARLIHLGVMQAVPPFEGKGLIMDVGGGSVEFIIAGEDKVHWAQSFPIGVQVLFSNFQKNDPISKGDLQAIQWHLEQTLQPLLGALQEHQTPLLLGASGSFEVVEDMLVEKKPHPLFAIVPSEAYYSLYYRMISTSLKERLSMSKLPPERAELIVVAFVLIEFVLRKASIRQIITSAYAMKEGILYEMLQE
jgi:exopolyphosphatase/guanosine-5'-triphosphate,3'-diphosphate pyrophosphatase